MKKIRNAAIVLLVVVVVFTITGFFVVPPLLKSILVSKLSENLGRAVTIEQIRVNPYILTLRVKGLVIKEHAAKERFVAFEELFVKLSPLSIAKRALVVNSISLKNPYFRVIRNPDESYNLSDLITKLIAEAPGKALKKKESLRFSLNNMTITGGSIDFYDGPKDTWHTVRDMTITIPFLSNMPHYVNTLVQPAFSAVINEDPYSIKGTAKPFADYRESYIDISIKDFDLIKYLAYVPVKMNFELLSGTMDLDGKVTFVEHKAQAPLLELKADVVLRDLALNDTRKKSLLRLPSVTIAAIAEPLKKQARLSSVVVEKPEIAIRRDETGRINVQSLVGQESDAKQKAVAKETPPRPAEGKDAFLLTVDSVQVKDGVVTFNDAVPTEPVELQLRDIQIEAQGLSTAKNASGRLSVALRLGRTGLLSLKGTVGIDPLKADMEISTKAIPVGAFQPYFTDRVKIAVTGGEVSLGGKVSVSDSQSKGLAATYEGRLLISNFSSVDKAKGEAFLAWKALSFSDLSAGYNPVFAKVEGISLSDFYTKIVVDSDGSVNLQKVMAEEQQSGSTAGAQPGKAPEPTAAGQKTTPPPDISIGAITLQGGTIDFSDRSIKPEYVTALTEIGGRIAGLSLTPGKTADLDLRGKMEGSIPIEITGKLNPSNQDLFADLLLKFRDLDLSPMSPYSGKYIGYTIQKGKLSVDLKYQIAKRKLDSTNLIFFDQLTLGDRVDSPDATKLPVRLAIALLKDRNGQIKLDIPVSGSIDDPKFSIGRIILQIIVNLIAKAATSPFALLGALFGGGQELSYIEFDYGSSGISDGSARKIDTLLKALYDRPNLQLDIEGHVDREKDTDGLRNTFFARKLKARKLEEMIKKGQAAPPVDDVKIEPPEYQKYLRLAYNTEKFAKPRNVVGMAKTLPPAEMEKLMLTNIVVKDDDLRALAVQRASAVKDRILKSGKVTADRVFVTEAKTLSPEKKANLKDSRVDFKLK